MERIIKKKGVISLPFIDAMYDRLKFIGYQYSNDVTTEYHYDWIYIYDGVKFIGGNFGMIELSTYFSTVRPEDIRGKLTMDKVIAKFKEKLHNYGKPLAVALRDTKNSRLYYLDTWVVNSLII